MNGANDNTPQVANDNDRFAGGNPALQRVATPPHQRINILMAVLLVGAAFVVDCVQGLFELLTLALAPIPVLNVAGGVGFAVAGSFLGVAADICFLIWLMFLGVKYMDKNGVLKILTITGMTAVTLIPGLDILPELTLGMLVLVVLTRMEDSVGGSGIAGAVGMAAKVAGKAIPQARIASRIIEMQAKRQQQKAQNEQQRTQPPERRETA